MISNVDQDAVGVVCRLDGRVIRLSWTWLRDHARDPESYLASAEQRVVTPPTVVAAGPGTAQVSDDGGVLTVTWPSGTVADFTAEWLGSLEAPRAAFPSMSELAEPWRGGELAARLCTLPFDGVDGIGGIDGEAGFRELLRHLARDGVVVVRNVPTNESATRSVVERFGYLRTTIFGELWTFSSDGGFDDTASTPLEITPHTDGTYSNDAPGLLALHCHRYDARGGENVFVDGHALAQRLAAEDPEALATLRSIEIPGRYIGDGARLVARRPALRFEGDRLVQISYNHHDRAPFLLPEPLMSEVYRALYLLDALANREEFQFEVALRPGDMVCFDNWRVLHGRRAFVGERLIAGGYVNREDVESTMRTAGLLVG